MTPRVARGDGAPRVVVGDISELQRTFAKEFELQAAEGIARRGKFVVGLPGGSVASAFFPIMCGLAVDWARIEIFWIDERAVPPDHPDSNYGLASRLLLRPARVPAARIHRMQGELPELDQAARRAADELRSVAGDPPRLDLALVGVGEDGHVASIFPGLSAVARSAKADGTGLPPSRKATADHHSLGEGGQPRPQPVIAVYDSPKPPSRRLTLTLSVLTDARLVVVAAFGASKAAIMRSALAHRGSASPVADLLRGAASSLVLLDREAGLS